MNDLVDMLLLRKNKKGHKINDLSFVTKVNKIKHNIKYLPEMMKQHKQKTMVDTLHNVVKDVNKQVINAKYNFIDVML